MPGALYARVSTSQQQHEGTIESQRRSLQQHIQHHGWSLLPAHEYFDDGVSGARLDRPALDRLRDAARRGEFDAVVIESVCFWGETLEVWVPLRYAPPMDPSYIPPCVYQFRVVVQGISPLIWRRLLVRNDMSLATLHAALQVVFAWSDTYLHSFHIHGKAHGTPQLDGPHVDGDARHVPLATLHLHRGERFSYVYNFIDHWVCDLRLEVVLPVDPQRGYPVCTGGKRAAPPEDCGGAWAYLQRVDRHHVPLEAMTVVARALDRLQKADDQTTMRQVIGDRDIFREAVDQLDTYLRFRPEHFDRRDVNIRLRALVQQEGI